MHLKLKALNISTKINLKITFKNKIIPNIAETVNKTTITLRGDLHSPCDKQFMLTKGSCALVLVLVTSACSYIFEFHMTVTPNTKL